MARGDASARLEAGSCRGRQTKRLEDPLTESIIERPTIEHLDEPTEDAVSAVVVGPACSGFVEKSDCGDHLPDVALQAVVTLPGVGEVVTTIDATRVGQKLADRHPLSHPGNRDTNVGQMRADGIVQRNLTTLHMLEHEQGCHRLGD